MPLPQLKVKTNTRVTAKDDAELVRLLRKDADGFERIVFAEVLIPDTPDVYGDIHTKHAIRDFAYKYMVSGFSMDVEHGNIAVDDGVHLIESFIARAADEEFIEGSWVVALHISDDTIWGKVLDGEINGFSYEAIVSRSTYEAEVPLRVYEEGMTQPDPFDGHTHEFYVLLNSEEGVLLGGTSETNGHQHTISRHTRTDNSFEHAHLFNYAKPYGDV